MIEYTMTMSSPKGWTVVVNHDSPNAVRITVRDEKEKVVAYGYASNVNFKSFAKSLE